MNPYDFCRHVQAILLGDLLSIFLFASFLITCPHALWFLLPLWTKNEDIVCSSETTLLVFSDVIMTLQIVINCSTKHMADHFWSRILFYHYGAITYHFTFFFKLCHTSFFVIELSLYQDNLLLNYARGFHLGWFVVLNWLWVPHRYIQIYCYHWCHC